LWLVQPFSPLATKHCPLTTVHWSFHMPNPSEIIAHIDGGSRGNPGPAAYGVAIKTPQGQSVTGFAKFLGKTTNNVAEYQGLLAALEYALSHGYARLSVFTDSELLARQMTGRYKVRDIILQKLHEKAQEMIARLESFSIQHVYRERNREADRLANQAMDDAESGKVPREFSPRALPSQPPRPASAKPLIISATFRHGALYPHTLLPLLDGEELELEIRRKK